MPHAILSIFLSLPARRNPPFRLLTGLKRPVPHEPAFENHGIRYIYLLGSVLLQPSFWATPKPEVISSFGIG